MRLCTEEGRKEVVEPAIHRAVPCDIEPGLSLSGDCAMVTPSSKRGEWQGASMRLDEQWRDVFAGGDLGRGEEYYYDGAVHGLAQGSEGWTAKVWGSMTYTTFVPAEPDDLYEMSCDCPRFANGYFCKHLAATCLAIEDSELQGQRLPADEAAADVRHIVDEVPADELRSFLLEALSRDDMLKTLFVQRYGTVDADSACSHMAKQIEAATWQYADRGFIDWHSALGFERRYHEIVHTSIDPLVERGDLATALELSIQALRLLRHIDIDDSDGFFGSSISDVAELWKGWLGTSDEFDALLFDRISEFLRDEPDDDQEHEIHSFAADMARSFLFTHYLEHPAFAQRFVTLADSMIEPAERELAKYTLDLERVRSEIEGIEVPRSRARAKCLAQVQQLERESRGLEFHMQGLEKEIRHWVVIRIKALRAGGLKEDELRHEAGDHIVYEEVCQLFVDMALRRDDVETALSLLLGCKEHQRALDGRYSPKISQQLADLQMGRNVVAMREELAYLMEHPTYAGPGPSIRELWVRLRDSYDDQEWQRERLKFLADMQNDNSRHDCLAAEGLYDQLMDEIETQGIYALRPHELELVEHCPERVLKLYLDDIERDRRYPGSTRKEYRYFAQRLQHIKAIPGGKAPVREIVSRMRAQYPNRPALRDELSVV